MHRGDELGVSLIISDDHDEEVDTRTLRCADQFVDPLLERLNGYTGMKSRWVRDDRPNFI
jgi:hypothetical protein